MSAPKIAVVDYGMGNLRSVCKALEFVGARPILVNEPDALADVSGVVFPGQGALGDCVKALKQTGLEAAVKEWIAADKPYLGVCLGLQVLFDYSEEADDPGLGIFPGRVIKFSLPPGYKIPHMGWNEARFVQEASPLRKGLRSEGDQFYFVHSYYVVPDDPSIVLCTTGYGIEFVSAVQKGRCFATQFHPEKSQTNGLTIYRNFVEEVVGCVV